MERKVGSDQVRTLCVCVRVRVRARACVCTVSMSGHKFCSIGLYNSYMTD